jgi:hypothetical protein
MEKPVRKRLQTSLVYGLSRFVLIDLFGQIAPLLRQIEILSPKCRVSVALGHALTLRGSRAVIFQF